MSDSQKLFEAVKLGDMETIKFLIEECDVSVEKGDDLIQQAVSQNHLPVLRYLVEECFCEIPPELKSSDSCSDQEISQYLNNRDNRLIAMERRDLFKQKNQMIRLLQKKIKNLESELEAMRKDTGMAKGQQTVKNWELTPQEKLGQDKT